jgi:hypothetical protein
MAHPDQSSHPVPVAGIAEPHQSAVTAILRAALQGVYSDEEAGMLIKRIRASATTSDGFTEGVPDLRPDIADPRVP